MNTRLATLVTALVAFAPLGCSVYEHQVDIQVRDPHRVWVQTERSASRIDPAGPGDGAILPGTHDRVERDESGVLRVGDRELVGRGGTLHSTTKSLDTLSRSGDTVLIPACYESRRRSGCARSVLLGTPWENLRVAREADTPSRLLGVLEILAGVGAGVGGAASKTPTSSGGSLLIGAGVVAVIAGVVQLAQPVKQERDLIERDTRFE